MFLSLCVTAAAALVDSSEITIGPHYVRDPATFDHGHTSGTFIQFTIPLNRSIYYNGRDAVLNRTQPGGLIQNRTILVHIPSSYVDGTPAPLLVMQDGLQNERYLKMIANAQENLEAATGTSHRSLPGFVTVGVENGGFGLNGLGTERNLEYDTMSDRYSRFVQHEVLPAVKQHPAVLATYPNLAFTQNPWNRATLGCSSGGSAALSMGWFRPDLFRRIAAFSVSTTPLQIPGLPEAKIYPQGAWDYHSGQRLIQQSHKRPLRVLLTNSEHDLGWHGNCTGPHDPVRSKAGCWTGSDGNPPGSFQDGRHNWVVAGNRTAAALKAKGYEYRHVFALNATHCAMFDDPEHNLFTDALVDSLVWLWDGYQASQ